MTFYNVLSALLFVGALRVLLLAFEASNGPNIFGSGCLVVLIFNDMLSTSYLVESKAEIKYTLPLMLIDLWNFLILALAMIVISPGDNLFNIKLFKIAGFLGQHSFWPLLALYWVFLMLWTYISGTGCLGQRRSLLLQFSVAAVFLAPWVLYILGLLNVARVAEMLALGYLMLYLVLIRQ